MDNTSALTGYLTYDLQATAFDSDWTSAALLVELTGGSIYQEPEGWGQNGSTLGAPDPAGFGLFPSSEFDTYLDGNGQTISFAGAAGDLGGDVLRFDTAQIDAAWYDLAPGDTGTFNLARVTLADTATGTWSLLTTTEDEHLFTLTGDIAGGIMEINTETIQAPTLTAMSVVNRADGETLITKTVTDSVRALAGDGLFGDAAYEASVREVLINLLLDEIGQQQSDGPTEFVSIEKLTPIAPGTTISVNLVNQFIEHHELYTFSKPEYLQSIAAIENSTLPEPGTVALLGLGGLALLRRR